jgi:hypothetical protein
MKTTTDSCECATADEWNERCFCVSLDRAALAERLDAQIRSSGAEDVAALLRTESSLSDVPVFVRKADVESMQRIAGAIDRVAKQPRFLDAVLTWAPDIARFAPGPIGAFMGYDFHLTTAGPRLIEVNSNAGGAFVNAELANAQRACCREVEAALHTLQELDSFERAVADMFESEWRRQRGSGRPSRIAIVDDDPTRQPMYPEFRLAQNLLQRRGIETLIVDPADLALVGAELRVGDRRIDLVYNRLVDFSLADASHAALRAAYLDGAVVVTPNPRVHALFADKRNLTLLGNPARLRELGVDERDVRVLEAAVPRTVRVTHDAADELWRSRRKLFFKPVASHGSKGVYRGKSVTRGAFAEIVEGDYVAQEYVQPSERLINVGGERVALKVDVRLYTYDGRVLLTAARTYRGQATNLRTPGGGFAPVFQV